MIRSVLESRCLRRKDTEKLRVLTLFRGLHTHSSIGVFNTMAAPVAPTPPVVIEQQPAPVINIPPAEKLTPSWIYAIIGIGAALAVMVIVRIVRTRRP